MRPLRLLPVLFLLPLLLTCTDAGLYAVDGEGPGSADRAELQGTACVPLAAGEAFPVKVLFLVPSSATVPKEVVGKVTDGLASLASRFSVPYIQFALVAYNTVATGLQGSFVDATGLQIALQQYHASEQGPLSLRAPLNLARALLSGDMQTGCRGTVARTRYYVVLLATEADTSCVNPTFNAGIDADCNALLTGTDGQNLCSSCELTRLTGELKSLAERLGAGEVTVQPVFINTTAATDAGVSPAVRAVQSQLDAIARSGGTTRVTTDAFSLDKVLNGLNYASLQRELVLKRLVATNRNVVSRAGKMLLDSDGDGVPDQDEEALGLDPKLADSDGDSLMDGVELRMGLKPQPGNPDVISGCDPSRDTDFDRLNDCEERVLGTDACVSDSDGDGLPDLVEALQPTNPLIAEDLRDHDGDGASNVSEVEAHTDPLSADLAYRNERGYLYDLTPTDPTPDGRACFHFRVANIGLMSPLSRPNPPYRDIPAGTNDLYLYMQFGEANDPHGLGIGSLKVVQIRYAPPAKRQPEGVVPIGEEEFVLGN